MKKATFRSPSREPLLRLPGQSIDEQMHRLFNEKLVDYLLVALGFCILALISWIQALMQSQLNPKS
jgi:hypothetical protein